MSTCGRLIGALAIAAIAVSCGGAVRTEPPVTPVETSPTLEAPATEVAGVPLDLAGVGLPPAVNDDGPPVLVGPFRTVPPGFSDRTSAAALANAELVDAAAVVPVVPERLRGMPSYGEPAYLPPGYVLEGSSAVLGSADVKSYEAHYRGPRGLEIIVARIVGFTPPYDLERPPDPPAGTVDLIFLTVKGDPAAFYKLRRGEMGGKERIIIANDRYVTIVVGDVDGGTSRGTMTSDELLRVAESIR